MANNRITSLLKNFKLAGNVISVEPFGNGHINSTYRIVTSEDEYILQEINVNAFKDVAGLMSNIEIVTKHIKEKGENSLDIIPTVEGKLYIEVNGHFYRMLRFIKDTVCYESIKESPSLAFKLGSAFGNFHHLLADVDASTLTDTIKDFHNTPKRFQNFLDAYKSASFSKRVRAEQEASYIINHKDTYSKVMDGLKEETIKSHVTHNDPKINNVLFDKATHEVSAVIDLDTVMSGSFLFDIGDAFRSLFTGENEDSRDLTKLKVDFVIFKEYMKGYLSEMKDDLTKREIELIPYSIYLLTIECGMRFLEDYFRGNVYFKVDYDEHNLIRSRTQITLAERILLNMNELTRIVDEIMGGLQK